jgi:hypothetical protein
MKLRDRASAARVRLTLRGPWPSYSPDCAPTYDGVVAVLLAEGTLVACEFCGRATRPTDDRLCGECGDPTPTVLEALGGPDAVVQRDLDAVLRKVGVPRYRDVRNSERSRPIAAWSHVGDQGRWLESVRRAVRHRPSDRAGCWACGTGWSRSWQRRPEGGWWCGDRLCSVPVARLVRARGRLLRAMCWPDAFEPLAGEERVVVAVHAFDVRELERRLDAEGSPQPRFWGELNDPPSPSFHRWSWIGDREKRLWRIELDDIIAARVDPAGHAQRLRKRKGAAERAAALEARVARLVDERVAAAMGGSDGTPQQ